MEEEFFLTEENELLLKVLTVLLESATRVLNNEYLYKEYIKINIDQHNLETHSRVKDELRSILEEMCSVFFSYIKDEGKFGWGISPDLRLIKKISNGDYESLDLIELLEYRKNLLEKIILKSAFDILADPLLPLRKVA